MKTLNKAWNLVVASVLLLGANISIADPLAFNLPTLSLPTFEIPEVVVDMEIPTPDLDQLWDEITVELISGPTVEGTDE